MERMKEGFERGGGKSERENEKKSYKGETEKQDKNKWEHENKE